MVTFSKVVGVAMWMASMTGMVHAKSFADEMEDPASGSRSTTISVQLPGFISNTNIYHRDAMFGSPFKQTQLTGRVVYVTKHKDHDGCSENYQVPTRTDDSYQGHVFFLVDRGDCTFMQKARIAQSKGAAAVIVVDNKCNPKEKQVIQSHSDSTKILEALKCDTMSEQRMPYMQYDHSGAAIKIPAFLIGKYDGAKIQDCYLMKEESDYTPKVLFDVDKAKADGCGKTDVVVQVAVHVVEAKEVHWALFLSANDIPKNIGTLHKVATGFAEKGHFTPRYLFYKAENFGCTASTCKNLCVFNEKEEGYCFMSQTANTVTTQGSQIVKENIHQMCIWKSIGEEAWWKYMEQFEKDKCDQRQSLEECGQTARKKVGINEGEVDKCVHDEIKSFSTVKEAYLKSSSSGAFALSLTVNSVKQNFGLSNVFIAREVCRGLVAEDRPPICKCTDDINLQHFEKCIAKGCHESSSKQHYCRITATCVDSEEDCKISETKVTTVSNGTSFSSVILIVIFVATVISLGAYFYHKRAKRQLQEEVRDILSEYMPLEELHSFGGASAGNGGFHRADDDNVGVI
mmetsp:Transcript_3509/g.5069  ORF Transcript_3509/g.5069 Transcript_3509/m.5069 type:complete len:571 (+) Transcript_3509:217-1929(+)